MTNNIFCWNCNTKQDLSQKIAFRAVCDKCNFYQHCCKNCDHHKGGLPNHCKIAGTETISDRSSMNYCEEFSLKTSSVSFIKSVDEVENKLFGSNDMPRKKDFDSLWGAKKTDLPSLIKEN